jgi:hypothetical protein
MNLGYNFSFSPSFSLGLEGGSKSLTVLTVSPSRSRPAQLLAGKPLKRFTISKNATDPKLKLGENERICSLLLASHPPAIPTRRDTDCLPRD